MKTLARMLIVLMLFTSVAKAQISYTTGNALLEDWRAYQRAFQRQDYHDSAFPMGYFMGWVAGFISVAPIQIPAGPTGVTLGQLCQILGKYLDDHPEKLHQSAESLAMSAFTEAFPQPGKN